MGFMMSEQKEYNNHPIFDHFVGYLEEESDGLFTSQLGNYFKSMIKPTANAMMDICDRIEGDSNLDYMELAEELEEDDVKTFFLEVFGESMGGVQDFEDNEDHAIRAHPTHMKRIESPVGYMYRIDACDLKGYPVSGFSEDSKERAFALAVTRYLILKLCFENLNSILEEALRNETATKH